MLSNEASGLIKSVYAWFNQTMLSGAVLNYADLKEYFAPNFVMQLNDEIIAKDHESLYLHFKKFKDSGATMRVKMPLDEMIVSEDYKKCIARYHIEKITTDNSVYDIEVIAIWHINNQKKLERMNEVVSIKEIKTKTNV